MGQLPAFYAWSSAPESHARINELYVYNSHDGSNDAPCWQAWLPNGVMEEFGCTADSRQSFLDSGGHQVFYKWEIDKMVDTHGDQIRMTYVQDYVQAYYVRDDALATITYDDPNCTKSSCNSWNPQVKIVFDAGQIVNMFGQKMAKIGVLETNISHDNLHYGNMVTYMRIKGIVPASSEPRK